MAGALAVLSNALMWPSALAIRAAMNFGGVLNNAGLKKHVPPGVASRLDLAYGAGPDEAFDLHFPEDTNAPRPAIVWVHGGGWVSGSKGQVANYLRILAAHGYTTAGIDYSVAPEAAYPIPLQQLDAALAHILANAAEYHVDPERIVLAGDSAGAHIVAQYAGMVACPNYRQTVGLDPMLRRHQLRAMLLFCGAYDLTTVTRHGVNGWFANTAVHAYSGTAGFRTDPGCAPASICRHVTAAFPPAFITGGNGDFLTPQSVQFAQTLEKLGCATDTLFFPDNARPRTPHVYQFKLDSAAGRLALERALAFLKRQA